MSRITSKFALRGAYAIALSVAGVVTAQVLKNRLGNGDANSGRKRLWMVNHYAVPADLPGGTRHSDLAEAIQGSGWDTTIFASSFNHNTHRFERPVRFSKPVPTERTDAATWKWLPTLPYESNNWKRYLNMVSFSVGFLATAITQPRPHAILGSSGHLLAPLGAWMMARWCQVPFILEVRDIWPDGLIDLGLDNKPVIALLRAIEKHLYRQADSIVVVAEGIGNQLVTKGVSPEKIFAIYHGVKMPAVDFSSEQRAAFRSARGWTDRTVVIWAGGIQPMNGLDTLIEAARLLANLPEILIVLVGDGSEKRALSEQASDLDNVQFYGTVPKSEVFHWLKSADIGVITAREYNAVTGVRARKALDYMAASLPVVSSIPGETERLLDAAGSGITVKWERPDRLAEAIRQLAGSSDLRAQMGRSGQDAVLTNHSSDTSGQQLAKLLTQVESS